MKNMRFLLIAMLALSIIFLPDQSIIKEKELQNLNLGFEETAFLPVKNFKPTYHWKEIKVEATAYCNCKYCTNSGKGITASGAKTSKGVIAAPDYIPFGTIIKLDGLGEFNVQDRGSGIKEKDGIIFVDVWFPSHQEAVDFGRKKNLKGWIKVNQN